MAEHTFALADAVLLEEQAFLSQVSGKTALVTGASRGIGASVARKLGRLGVDVAINYRSKASRAQEVASGIIALGRRALLLQADVTDPQEVAASFARIRTAWGRLDLLVLNASGGLEQDKAPGYALRLNRDAQIDLVQGALP